jgi:hypothetical protein
MRDKMLSLDSRERSVLREFVLTGQNTVRLPAAHPTVLGLQSAGVLQSVGRLGTGSVHGPVFSYQVSEHAAAWMDAESLGLPRSMYEGSRVTRDE